MKNLKHFAIACIYSLLLTPSPSIAANNTEACKDISNGSMAFMQFVIQPNAECRSLYTFFMTKKIYCYSDNPKHNGIISWPIDGAQTTATLPIVLKENNKIVENNFKSSKADSYGYITIQNTSNAESTYICMWYML